MDPSGYPHIVEAIVQPTAANYTSGRDFSTALALRATCRTFHDAVDKHLFHHIALKDYTVYTPLLHRLPVLVRSEADDFKVAPMSNCSPASDTGTSNAPCPPRSSKPVVCKDMTGHARIIDAYSYIPKANFSQIELVRCDETVSWAAPTLMQRVGDPSVYERIRIPDSVRRCCLRWHPYPSRGDAGGQSSSPPESVTEVEVFLPEIDWRAIYPAYLEQGFKPQACDASREAAIVSIIVNDIFKYWLYNVVVERGGHVTFIAAFEENTPNSDWPAKVLHSLRDLVHEKIVFGKYGIKGDWKVVRHVPLRPQDKHLMGNVKVLTAEEWRATANKLELDWLDPKSIP